MSSLLVKEPSTELHDWLRDEARFNGRSINRQVIVCLEWCMKTYGAARPRPPFGESGAGSVRPPLALEGRSLRGSLTHLRPTGNGLSEKNAWRKAAEAKHANPH